jgi:hypothetical protein
MRRKRTPHLNNLQDMRNLKRREKSVKREEKQVNRGDNKGAT